MTRFVVAFVVFALMASLDAGRAFAQPAPNQPIAFHHWQVTGTDMDAQKRFWVATLGGKLGYAVSPSVPGNHPLFVAFPGTLVEIIPGKSQDGTKGSTIDHVAFQVKNLHRFVEALKQAGYRIVTSAEMPAGGSAKGDIGKLPGQKREVAYVMGPDDIKLEILENGALKEPIAFDHLHFMAPAGQQARMREWYKTALGATDGGRGTWYESLDMPGLKGALHFSEASGPVAGTAGRTIGHIAFEVRELHRVSPDLVKRVPGLPASRSLPPDLEFTATKDPFGTDVQFTEHPSGLFFESR